VAGTLRTYADQVRDRVAESPEDVAVSWPEGVLSHADLDGLARQVRTAPILSPGCLVEESTGT
jgi:hypothetical protein